MAKAQQKEIGRTVTLDGLTLRHNPANADVALLQSFEIGQSGIEETRRVWDLMESPAGSANTIRMMNYSFVCFDGHHPMNYDQTVVLIAARDLALSHFLLTKKRIFHCFERLTPALTFAKRATFNKLYGLAGEDEIALRAVFTPQVCAALEQHPGLTIEGRGPQLLIFRERIVLNPGEWPAFLGEAHALAELFRR